MSVATSGPASAALPGPLYGLDIETDTSVNGLDPATSRIVAVALVAGRDEWVFEGDEAHLLADLDRRVAALQPGTLVTWNGANFDLPFLARRAELVGVRLGLELRLDPDLVLPGGPLPGEPGAYRARWHGHRHLDGYRLYRADVGALGWSCGLKAMARLVGLDAVELDASALHLVEAAQVREYVASDARVARELVSRRMPAAAGFADP